MSTQSPPEVEHVGRTLCITPQQSLFQDDYDSEREKARVLVRIMDEKCDRNVLIDCRHVSWGGEAFFDFLLHLCKVARPKRGQVVLCNCPRQLLEAAKSMHFDMLMTFCATREETLTQLES
jgi:anti-anti-sigma regulatory factor